MLSAHAVVRSGARRLRPSSVQGASDPIQEGCVLSLLDLVGRNAGSSPRREMFFRHFVRCGERLGEGSCWIGWHGVGPSPQPSPRNKILEATRCTAGERGPARWSRLSIQRCCATSPETAMPWAQEGSAVGTSFGRHSSITCGEKKKSKICLVKGNGL